MDLLAVDRADDVADENPAAFRAAAFLHRYDEQAILDGIDADADQWTADAAVTQKLVDNALESGTRHRRAAGCDARCVHSQTSAFAIEKRAAGKTARKR